MRIYDKTGAERDWQWVQDRYGMVRIFPAPAGLNAYKLIALREREDFAGIELHVQDELEMPEAGVRIVQGWRDGPQLSPVALPTGGLPPLLPNCGSITDTDEDGRCSFSWGGGTPDLDRRGRSIKPRTNWGEYYDPERQEGAHYYWIPGLACDVLAGIGMLFNSEHAHLEPLWRFTLVDDEPEPPEPETDSDGDLDDLLSELAEALADALEIIAEIREVRGE